MSQPRSHGKFAAVEKAYPDETERPGGEVMLAVHHLESLLDDLSTLVYSLRNQIESVVSGLIIAVRDMEDRVEL